MRIDYPSSYTERIGAVSIHALQKIYELDSGEHPSRITSFPIHPSTTTIPAPATTLTPNSALPLYPQHLPTVIINIIIIISSSSRNTLQEPTVTMHYPKYFVN